MAGPDGSLRIELIEEAGDWAGLDAGRRIGAIAEAVSGHLVGASGTVALVLADDELVQDLNRRFRGKDTPTNVLSFPGDDMPMPGLSPADPHLGDTALGDTALGDVVLAAETVQREARGDGKSIGDHFSHLAVHGILHLLGYDHESAEDAEEMESLETAILADLGIADPYAEPAIAEGAAGDH